MSNPKPIRGDLKRIAAALRDYQQMHSVTVWLELQGTTRDKLSVVWNSVEEPQMPPGVWDAYTECLEAISQCVSFMRIEDADEDAIDTAVLIGAFHTDAQALLVQMRVITVQQGNLSEVSLYGVAIFDPNTAMLARLSDSRGLAELPES